MTRCCLKTLFYLEIKSDSTQLFTGILQMADLNQNKKLQQSYWSDPFWKLYFTLEINQIQPNCLQVFYKIVVIKIKEICKRGPKLVFFNVQHIFSIGLDGSLNEKLIEKFCISILLKEFSSKVWSIFLDTFSLGSYK